MRRSMTDRLDNGCSRSVAHVPVQSSLSTAARASPRSTSVACSTSAIVMPDRAAASTLTTASSSTNWGRRPPPRKPDVAQHGRVSATPHLIAPPLARTQPASPRQHLRNRRLIKQCGRFHVDDQIAAVVQLQEEVGHMTAKAGTVTARQPEGLPADRTHSRVEVGQPQPVTLQQALVADQAARRRRPQQPGIVALTLMRGELTGRVPSNNRGGVNLAERRTHPTTSGQEADLRSLHLNQTTRRTSHK